MQQVDWVGEPERKPAKDLPNLRPDIAEQKAILVRRINLICNKVPKGYQGMSVNSVREFKKRREEALKVAGNKRSSVHELSAALSNVECYE